MAEKEWHSHLGGGPGLEAHHLPQQADNWIKNLTANIERGNALDDINGMAGMVEGFGTASYGIIKGAMGNDCEYK